MPRRSGGARRRRATPEAFVCGRLPVFEALRAERRPLRRLLLHPGKSTPEIEFVLAAAAKRGIPVEHVDRRELDRLTSGAHHQGIAAEAGPYPYVDYRECLASRTGDHQFWLLLDHIEDPQNLGSLLRTAESAGVTAVVIPADRAAGVTEAAVRASAGAAEHVRVCRVPNLVQVMKALQKELGARLFGLEAEEGALPVFQADLSGDIGLVVGSEGRGLKRLVRETCDGLLALPMAGQVTSLNAGVSGAIAMYEVVRQRAEA